MNKLWDYKVHPEGFGSSLELRERKIVGLEDQSQKTTSTLMG